MNQRQQYSLHSVSPTTRMVGGLCFLLAMLAWFSPGSQVPWSNLSHAQSQVPRASQIAKGKQLFASNACAACHSIDGSKRLGPSLLGIHGQPVKLTNGKTIVRDAAYYRTQLLTPKALVVAGYPPVMPSYKGKLSDADLVAITAYIQSLTKAKPGKRDKPAKPTKARPKPRKAALAPTPQTPAALALGKHYYRLNCAFCHGLQGKGDAPGARGHAFPPKDLSKDKLLYGNDNKAIYNIITNGSPRTSLMPAWNTLPHKIRWAIAHYVTSLRQ